MKIAPKKLNLSKFRRLYPLFFYAAIAVSALLIFASAYQTRYIISNIDGISYLSIARQYAEGNFATAINAYWSPMVSWLMAPLIVLGLDGQLAFMAINFLTAFLIVILGCWFLWKRAGKNYLILFIFLGSIVPFLMVAVRENTPDLLVVVWVLLFTVVIIEADELLNKLKKISQKILLGFLIGAIGALGYFTKLFLIPVFFTVIICWVLLRYVVYKESPKQVIGFLGVILAGFLLVSLPWIAMLTNKYGNVTMGSSFTVNIEGRFDPSLKKSQELLPSPPNEHAVSYNEDRTPSNKDAGEDKTIFTLSNLKHYTIERVKAFPFYVNRIFSVSPFALPVMFMTCLAMILGIIKFDNYKNVYLTSTVFFVYFLGYAAITSSTSGGGNTRYYWPLLPVSLFVFLLLLPHVWKKYLITGGLIKRVIFISMVLFIPFSFYLSYIQGIKYPYSIPIGNPLSISAPNRKTPLSPFIRLPLPAVNRLANEIKAERAIPKGSRIVSNNYRTTVGLAYLLESQVFGISGRGYNYTDSSFIELYKKNNIEYFFEYTPTDQHKTRIENPNIIGVYEAELPCEDFRGAPDMPCTLRIIKL